MFSLKYSENFTQENTILSPKWLKKSLIFVFTPCLYPHRSSNARSRMWNCEFLYLN